MREQTQVLGIDAGGSGSRWALADAEGHVLREGRGLPLQLANVELDAAVRAILALVREPLAQAPSLGAFVAGFAGAGDLQRRQALEALLCTEVQPGARLRIVTDLEIGAAQALADGPGVAAFAGTGSFVIARTPDGDLLRAGGRGPWLGDQGSGYDLVRCAARLALLGLDGIGPAPGDLAEALVACFDAPALARLGVVLARATPGAVAAAAPMVLKFAEHGEAHAVRAVELAFEGLADQVVALAARSANRLDRLVVGGSVLRESATARGALASALRRRALECRIEPVTSEPAHAAANLAAAWLAGRRPLSSWVDHGAT